MLRRLANGVTPRNDRQQGAGLKPVPTVLSQIKRILDSGAKKVYLSFGKILVYVKNNVLIMKPKV